MINIAEGIPTECKCTEENPCDHCSNDFIPASKPRPCLICELPSNWVEIDFEAPLHPGHCFWLLLRAYINAVNEKMQTTISGNEK